MDISLPIAIGMGMAILLLIMPNKLYMREPTGKHEIVEVLQQDRKTIWKQFEERLAKSRSGWGINQYVTLSFLLGIASFGVSSQILQSWWMALPALLAGIMFTERLVSVWGARRKDDFEAGNVKAIRLMASSLRTSPSYLHAFEQVAASPFLSEIVLEEYRRIVELLRAQVPLEHVMNRFFERTGSADVKYLATIVHIQREMGGDMAKTLDLAASSILRRRQSLRRQKAAMAQIVAQVNLLSVMPFVFVIALYVNNPNHFDPLTATVGGRLLILGSLASILIGGEAIRYVAQKSISRGA
ncbi:MULTISPECIES: type II secretion system F family protein [Brevibacillus]|uniref:Pilus assembly protein TadB n=1 Tax=Brevibacillus porteri TaxID=2126350 RepID=A0ABX5FK26_9BACL|nr:MULTISPECIES: type II secretion system F family protein [Brevibacillus]MDC0765154.1 type II secretion system F family protein [Brevibacillus sp. AG]MED1802362.1 type II secretion system F family protein [Brevibacillus porteri]MED2130873.1 type II secretion system F family protein [Brevibacillus porteri]MED2745636.1 type II secretion system F family protein [Brevibacillus porteri]MED2818135.1 type II secretion system F family protein [Brevibacillus porteri]